MTSDRTSHRRPGDLPRVPEASESSLQHLKSPFRNYGGTFETHLGANAVVDHLRINNRFFQTILSDDTFGLGRAQQTAYARQLNGRLPNSEEHIAYVRNLLLRELDLTISEAGRHALQSYRVGYVRDTWGGISLRGIHIVTSNLFLVDRFADPFYGALIVRKAAY